MAEHVLWSREVDADEWTAEHRQLADSAVEQGLPAPTRASYIETTFETESLDGDLLDAYVVREAAVSNPRRP